MQTSSREADKKRKGITGLEKVIILIAFIVIAATCTYAVITTGLFSAGKNHEPEAAGLEESGETPEHPDNFIATITNTGGEWTWR